MQFQFCLVLVSVTNCATLILSCKSSHITCLNVLGITVVDNDLATGKATEDWSPKDIREFPTNAFGKIDFIYESLGGRKPAKVICLWLAVFCHRKVLKIECI